MQTRVSIAIINVDTIGYTALAALSACRHLPFPVQVIDCSQRPRQIEACTRLSEELGIDRRRWPLRPHGETLDRLFSEADEDWIVLLDSDAEILEGGLFIEALARAVKRRSYGVGWLQETGRAIDAGSPITLYMERPWVPFCAFAVEPVKRLLADGESFLAQRIDNDLCWLPQAARRLISFRRHVPGLRRLDLDRLQSRQLEVDGQRAPYIDFDTAARLHRTARSRGLDFESLHWESFERSVFHVHGGTRKLLNRMMPNTGALRPNLKRALRRIRSVYGDLSSSSLADVIERTETTR